MKNSAAGRRISAAMAVFATAVAFVFLYVASPCSPIYVTNISYDANAIFTVGRAWADGAVIYKDIFEQKGPLLYLINMLAAKIISTSFTGIFVFEVLAFAVTLFFAYKILALYVNPAWALPVLPLIMAAMCNSVSYAGANTAEEFCVPMLAALLFILLSYYKNGYPRAMSGGYLAVNGFLAGCVLMIKYSMLGFWFGFMAAYFFVAIFALHKVRHAFAACFIFLGAMALSTVPWFIYFALKGALREFIETYFVINITAYPAGGLLSSVLDSPASFFAFAIVCRAVGAAVVLGALLLVFSNAFAGKAKAASRLHCLSVMLFGVLLSMTSSCVTYVYYFYIFMPFAFIPFIRLCCVIDGCITKVNGKKLAVCCGAASAAAVCLMMALTVRYNVNYNQRRLDSRELPQYSFAEYINSTEDAVILNYGFLDGGFFLASGELPQFRFFEHQNIPYDYFRTCRDEQNRYIAEGLPDYVIVRSINGVGIMPWEDNQDLKRSYTCIAEDSVIYVDNDLHAYNICYYLFARNRQSQEQTKR